MSEFQAAIEQIKELIELKFNEMEKRLQLKDNNTDLRFRAIESIQTKHEAQLATIEKNEKIKSSKTWSTIKETFIKWAVPFTCIGVLYYMLNGKL